MIKQFLIALTIVSIASFPVYAQPKSPVEITADKFELDLNKLTSVFTNNVKINFYPYSATCQKARVLLNKSQKVIKVIMSGNVLVQRGNSIFRGKTIILDVVKNKLEVQGQVYTRLDPAEFKANFR